ncbi:hypothetical protein N9W57_09200 [Pseudomonadales bacterium]|nr:hypothetical protein [Pseudomonadales bacterium]
MNSKPNIKVTVVTLMALLLSACGYQLQKPLSIEADTQPIYVEGDRLIGLALKQQLRANGITLSKTASSASSIIHVSLIDSDSRSYSLSVDARDAEVLRSMTASLEWHRTTSSSSERQILEKTTVSAEVVQVKKPDNVAAQDSESEILVNELRDRLTEKMISLIRYR